VHGDPDNQNVDDLKPTVAEAKYFENSIEMFSNSIKTNIYYLLIWMASKDGIKKR